MTSHKILKIGLMRQPCSSCNLYCVHAGQESGREVGPQCPMPDAHLQVWDWIGTLIPTDASWAGMMQVVGSGWELWRGYYDSAVGSVYRCAVSFGLWSHYHLFTSHVPTSQSAPACTVVVAVVLFCSLPSESSVIEWSVCFINAVCNYCICITNKATWAVSTQIPYQHDVLEHFQVM